MGRTLARAVAMLYGGFVGLCILLALWTAQYGRADERAFSGLPLAIAALPWVSIVHRVSGQIDMLALLACWAMNFACIWAGGVVYDWIAESLGPSREL